MADPTHRGRAGITLFGTRRQPASSRMAGWTGATCTRRRALIGIGLRHGQAAAKLFHPADPRLRYILTTSYGADLVG